MSATLAPVDHRHLGAPTEPQSYSSSLRDGMPHVFVIPPEEEQFETPPWCCFNANGVNDPDSDDDYDDHPSDLQYIDVALDFIHDADGNQDIRVSMEGTEEEEEEIVAVPRKAEKRSSSVLSFMSYRNDGEGRQHGARELPEDVIEVIKVRRNEGKSDFVAGPAPKRSKTIKMPFQKAFKSIKNVGKSSSSKKPHAKDIWPGSQSAPGISKSTQTSPQKPQEEIVPRAPTPMLTRQGSRRLSQLFSRSNNSNIDLTSSPSDPITLSSSTTESSTLTSQANPGPSPMVDELGVALEPNTERPISPSLSSRRSSRRFSVLDLHRIFTFSSIPSIPVEDQELSPRGSQDAPSLPTLVSRDGSSVPSTTSSEFSAGGSAMYPVDEQGHWRSSADLRHSTDEPKGVPGDLGFEMRLDSLHFDSLSFDPEEFDVSLAIDGQRRL